MAKRKLKVNLPEIISTDLEQRIQSNEWAIGDKLPPEATLAEEYGVTRITVRMALNRLEAIGLLDIRNGDGSYVQEINLGDFTRQMSNYVMTEARSKEFIDFRQMIEIESARIFFRNYDPERLAPIRKICDDYKRYSEALDFTHYNLQDFIEETKRFEWHFHKSIVDLSDNFFLINIYTITKTYLDKFFASIVAERVRKKNPEGFLQTSLNRHLSILESLYEQDIHRYIRLEHEMLSPNERAELLD